MLGRKARTGAALAVALAAMVADGPATAEAAKAAAPKLTRIAAKLPAPRLLDVTVRLRATSRGARSAKVRILLSANKRLDRRDVLFGQVRTKKLKRRKSAATRLRRMLPAAVSGRRYVLACLGRRCVATPRPLLLTAPAPPAFVPPFAAPAPAPAPAPTPAPESPAPSPPAPQPTPAPPAEPMPTLPAAVVAEVDALAQATTLSGQIDAGRALLASAGIGERGAAEEPDAGILLTPMQLMQVSRDGHDRATQWRTTLAELADQLVLTGLPFKADRADGSVSSPSSALRDFLAAAARSALTAPDDPAGRPVLLLAELARRQADPIDLTIPDYDPAALKLGQLDVLLLTAQITSLAPVVRADQPAPAPRSASTAALSATPCTDVQKELEAGMVFGGDSYGYLTGKAAGETLKKIAKDLAEAMGGDAELAGTNFDQFMTALNVLAKIQALAMLYDHAQTKVVPEVELMDKPDPGQPTHILTYEVVAGVDDAEWEAYRTGLVEDPLFSAMKDCATVAGLPVPTSLADLGGAVSGWRVSFRITEGLGFHGLAANQTYLNPGQLEKQLLPRDDHSGRQEFFVEVQVADDPLAGGGRILEEPLTVEASVETDAPPKVGMLISAIEAQADPLGLVGPIADIAAGLFQNLRTINGSGTTMIRFAEPGAWYGRIAQTVNNQLGTHGKVVTDSGGGYVTTQTQQRNEFRRRRTTVHIGSPIDDAASQKVAVSGGVVETLDISSVSREHSTRPPFADWCTYEIDTEAFVSQEVVMGGGSVDRSAPYLSADGGTLMSAAGSALTAGGESDSLHRERYWEGGEDGGCVKATLEPDNVSTYEAGQVVVGASVPSPVAGYVTADGDRRFRDTVEVQQVVASGPGISGGVQTTRTEIDLIRR